MRALLCIVLVATEPAPASGKVALPDVTVLLPPVVLPAAGKHSVALLVALKPPGSPPVCGPGRATFPAGSVLLPPLVLPAVGWEDIELLIALKLSNLPPVCCIPGPVPAGSVLLPPVVLPAAGGWGVNVLLLPASGPGAVALAAVPLSLCTLFSGAYTTYVLCCLHEVWSWEVMRYIRFGKFARVSCSGIQRDTQHSVTQKYSMRQPVTLKPERDVGMAYLNPAEALTA